MSTCHLRVPIVEFKASDSEPGVFHALFAVFDNVDDVGDRIIQGAFTRTLAERPHPPIVWSHQWHTPPIGETRRAKETSRGVEAEGRLFVGEGDGHDLARQVYAGLRSRALREFSFGYARRESATVTEEGEDITELRDVDLFEWGPTLKGANPATALLDVKSAPALADAIARALATERSHCAPPNAAGPPNAARVRELVLAGPNDPND